MLCILLPLFYGEPCLVILFFFGFANAFGNFGLSVFPWIIHENDADPYMFQKSYLSNFANVHSLVLLVRISSQAFPKGSFHLHVLSRFMLISFLFPPFWSIANVLISLFLTVFAVLKANLVVCRLTPMNSATGLSPLLNQWMFSTALASPSSSSMVPCAHLFSLTSRGQ